jgi:SET domain
MDSFFRWSLPVSRSWRYSCCSLLLVSRVLLLLLLLTPKVVVIVSAGVVDQAIVDELIAWVESAEHGFWNGDKIEIRKADDGDYLGVFAKADIATHELLLQIPRDRYIHIMDDSLSTDYEDQRGFDNYYTNVCRLATKLQQELLAYTTALSSSSTTSNNTTANDDNDNDGGNTATASSSSSLSSPYGPYLAYLQQQTTGQLPATWSTAGKDRLRQVLPAVNRDVVDWIEMHFTFCTQEQQQNEDQQGGVDRHLIALTVQRGYDVALIPLWDMVNHDNGRVNVGTNSWHDPHGMRVAASRPIKAGQEIFATYDKCTDCADVAEYWGTTEILRDFGFVEPYPQRWTWDDQRVWFEVHQRDETTPGADGTTTDTNPVLSVIWDEHSINDDSSLYYGPLQGTGLEFVQRELARLQQLRLLFNDDDECLALPHECHWIQQYHQSLSTALSLAIIAAAAAAEPQQVVAAVADATARCQADTENTCTNPTYQG